MSPMILSFGVVVAFMALLAVRHNNNNINSNKQLQQEDSQKIIMDEKKTYHTQSYFQQQDEQNDNNNNINSNAMLPNVLSKARQIKPPPVTLTSGGEYEHGEFWKNHDFIFKNAWNEWYNRYGSYELPSLLDYDNRNKIMNPKLVHAIEQVRNNPTIENETKLKQEFFIPILHHHVFRTTQWFTPYGVKILRQHLDAASYYYYSSSSSSSPENTTTIKAGIPTRRPNGMNRYGIIIDPTIEGAVSYEHLNTYIHDILVKEFVRPIARMLFPEFTSRYNSNEDDIESYAFTIRYNPKEDLELKEHSDASIYTININLNIPKCDENENDKSDENNNSQCQEEYEGSSLYFLNPDRDNDNNTSNNIKEQTNVTFAPGMAVLHRGIVRHASLPITNGERHNLVIWLFGKHGYVRIGEYPSSERLTVQERWNNDNKNNNNNNQQITYMNKFKNILKFGGSNNINQQQQNQQDNNEDEDDEEETYTDDEL